MVGMEATISERALVGVRSSGEPPELRPQGSSLLLVPFPRTNRYLSLQYKYGHRSDIPRGRT